MSTQQDCSIGFKKETTWPEKVVVDAFPEFTAEDFAYNPTYSDPTASHRVGRRVAASDRRVLVKEEASGSFTTEVTAKGLGKLFEAALGTATSTQIGATAAYQQLFTPLADDLLPSYTIQKGLPPIAGSVATQTYAGMVCAGFELTAPNVGVPMIKWNWLGHSVDLVTDYATPSYIASNPLLSFVHGSIRIGGSVTVPDSDSLASGGTDAVNVRDISLTYDNGLDGNGFNFGAAGRRSRKSALGIRSISGTMTIEYDSNTIRDAYFAQTELALVLDFALPTAIEGSNYPTLQLTAPVIRLDGELPKANNGDVITQSVPFTVLDGRTAGHPFYVAIVTAETAI
jgi:hypothetical protein